MSKLDNFREIAHQFCDGLPMDTIPTSMTVGGRTYEILGFVREDEERVVGHTMVERAIEMNANLGENDGQYILDHQDEIPAALRGRNKVLLVLTDWRHPDGSEEVACLYCDGNCWHLAEGLSRNVTWDGRARVLRRK